MSLQATVENSSGQVYSVKTFKILCFKWTSSIWRQFPMKTCIATLLYDNQEAAEQGHKDLKKLLRDLEIGPKMREPFDAIDTFAQKRIGNGVRSHRIYKGHELEGKMEVEIRPERKRRD